jgi:hypothetical protein
MPPFEQPIPDSPVSVSSSCSVVSTRGSSAKRGRVVRFSSDEPAVFDLLDLSDEELADVYYSAEQFALLRNINNVLTKMQAEGEKEDLSRFCYRGLLTPSEKKQQRKMKQRIITAVMDFQECSEGDAEQLASICKNVASKAVQEAIQRGREDAQEVLSASAKSFKTMLKQCSSMTEFNLDAMEKFPSAPFDDDDDDQTVYSVTDVLPTKKKSPTSTRGLRKLSLTMRKSFRLKRGKQ